MGWTITYETRLKEMIKDRTTREAWTRKDGTAVKDTCITKCYRGSSYSGTLWIVWERSETPKDGETVKHRWIECDLLRYYRGRGENGWGYKDMQESMHPYYFNCPLSYLTLVPDTEPHTNAEWRQRVRERYAHNKKVRQCKVGDVLKLDCCKIPEVTVVSKRPFIGEYGGLRYRIKPSLVCV